MTQNENQSRAALLDRAAAHARLAQEAASLAGVLVIREPEQAREQAAIATNEAGRALDVLCERLGATVPGVFTDGKPAQPAPLDLNYLATLNTPAVHSEIAGHVRGEVFGRTGNGEGGKDTPIELVMPLSITDTAAAIDADIDADINAQMNAHVNDTAASQSNQTEPIAQTTDDEGPCGR